MTPRGSFLLPPNATHRIEPVYLTDITRESEYQAILPILPPKLHDLVNRYLHEVDEIKMDANKPVQLRIRDIHIRHDYIVTQGELDTINGKVGGFKSNGRKGVPNSTHRVAAGYNDMERLDKVTFRVGRILRGVAAPFRDIILSSKGIGICGIPASGKTTFMRDSILLHGEHQGFGINVVDTSNEIMGEGDTPHPAFLNVRQDKVGEPENLVPVLKRAIRSHGTKVIYADEVGYEQGDVQLVLQADRFGPKITSSVHGDNLRDVLQNQTLMPLFGIQESADGSRRIIGKPAFQRFIEVRHRNHFVVHDDLSESVERLLRNEHPRTEHVFTHAKRAS